ncbi:2TM domain-containing protein [Ralstonia sp. 25mfcol4.1]|uniref:2TM domain-containing protein n=1 Tax=Burkholderiaceae TaxID=119060 RepID=UPI00088326D9|nr:2TM domain-containing protein [Ralstonia sp. 25mfcol4.1]SDP24426.1 2TM domain-containing protein [Ralstonia sp. 25mfcol4.1]
MRPMHPPFPNASADDDQAWAYWRARRMVRALRGWYIHLLIYVVVNGWLWLRFFYFPTPSWSHYATSGWPWPLTTTLAWGLGLGVHGILVWTRLSRWGRDWETRKIQEFMNRQR